MTVFQLEKIYGTDADAKEFVAALIKGHLDFECLLHAMILGPLRLVHVTISGQAGTPHPQAC